MQYGLFKKVGPIILQNAVVSKCTLEVGDECILLQILRPTILRKEA